MILHFLFIKPLWDSTQICLLNSSTKSLFCKLVSTNVKFFWCNFGVIMFLPKHTAEAPETPCTPFMHPLPWGVGYWVDTPQETSRPQGPPTCQISSRSIQWYGFLLRTYTYIALLPPGRLKSKNKKTCVS